MNDPLSSPFFCFSKALENVAMCGSLHTGSINELLGLLLGMSVVFSVWSFPEA